MSKGGSKMHIEPGRERHDEILPHQRTVRLRHTEHRPVRRRTLYDGQHRMWAELLERVHLQRKMRLQVGVRVRWLDQPNTIIDPALVSIVQHFHHRNSAANVFHHSTAVRVRV